LTGTAVRWFPVFSDPMVAYVILDSLKFLQDHSRMTVYAYVIMENHLHLVASSLDLSKEFGNFKSFTAHQVIAYYKDSSDVNKLRRLHNAKPGFKKDSEFQFWQTGSHPKQIQTRKMMIQKIDYIHFNPVRRGYVDDPLYWRYSSACNYSKGTSLIPVCTDW
jgi:REP element-mobilizing transposase RayT